jgi:hypothetical protein
MPDDEEPKIIADDDWKAEARAEKERLAKEAAAEEAAKEEGQGEASPFLALLDLLAQQAVLALGGAQLPNGQTLPANPQAAQLFIDMLADIETKTKGNLTKEESEILTSLLSRLRWAFSMGGSGAGAPGAAPPEGAPPAAEEGTPQS